MRTIEASTIFFQDTTTKSMPDGYLGKEIDVIRALRYFEHEVFGARGETSSYFTRRQFKYSCCATEVLALEIKQRFFDIPPTDKLDSQKIIHFLRSEDVEIIPVFWGKQEKASSNLLSIRMNAGGNHFLLLNMSASAEDLEYMLALGYGHFIAIESMEPSEAEEFSHDLAWHLLNPCGVSIQPPETFGEYRQADRNLSQNLGEILCEMKNPDASAIKKMARARFGTRFFDAIGWIQINQEPSPDNTASIMANRIASALCIEVADAEPYSVGPGLIIV